LPKTQIASDLDQAAFPRVSAAHAGRTENAKENVIETNQEVGVMVMVMVVGVLVVVVVVAVVIVAVVTAVATIIFMEIMLLLSRILIWLIQGMMRHLTIDQRERYLGRVMLQKHATEPGLNATM
jgi:uncharacterized membrane protein